MEKIHVAVIEKNKLLDELAGILTNSGYLVFKTSDEYAKSINAFLASATAASEENTLFGEFVVRRVK